MQIKLNIEDALYKYFVLALAKNGYTIESLWQKEILDFTTADQRAKAQEAIVIPEPPKVEELVTRIDPVTDIPVSERKPEDIIAADPDVKTETPIDVMTEEEVKAEATV